MKRIVFSLLFFLSLFHTSAQIFREKELHVSVEPFVAVSRGTLGEMMYYDSFYDSSRKISYLEWEKNLFLFGMSTELEYKKIHFEAGAASSFFEQNSGEMRDSDYLNPEDYSMKTTYSIGDNSAVENYEFHASLYYDFETLSWLTLSPLVGFSYSYDSFERREAEGWYSDGKHWWYDETSIHYPQNYWNGSRNVTLKLAQIDFYRKTFTTWAGFKAKITPYRRLHFIFDLLISPYSYFYAVDSHHAQESVTKKMYKRHYKMIQTSYMNMLLLSAGAVFSVNEIFDITIGCFYSFTFEAERGTLYTDYVAGDRQDKYYKSGQDSGTSTENFTAKLGCKIKIR